MDAPAHLALYHFDACTSCGEVRRALEVLGVEAELRDVRTEPEHLHELREATGRTTVPVLRVETAAGAVEWLAESRAIVAWLYQRYGEGKRPPSLGPQVHRIAGVLMWVLFGLALVRPTERDLLFGGALGLGAMRAFLQAARTRSALQAAMGSVFLLGVGSVVLSARGDDALPWWYGAYALAGLLVLGLVIARGRRALKRRT